jgi:hypothetical protein
MEFGVKDANCLYASSFFVWLRKQTPWWVGAWVGWLVGRSGSSGQVLAYLCSLVSFTCVP